MKRFEFIPEEEEPSNSKSSATSRSNNTSSKSRSNKSKLFSLKEGNYEDDDDLEGIQSIMSGLNKNKKDKLNSQRTSLLD